MEVGKLAEVTGGTLRRDDHKNRRFAGVSIDSRHVGSGQLFIALRGQRVDGHAYVESALNRGAAAALVNSDSDTLARLDAHAPLVMVSETHDAMIRLAKSYRDTISAKRIGITGSNGKTTTKEFAFTLLSAVTGNVFRSPGNLNNLYGAPLALLAMPGDTRYAVLEMGVSVPGEMAKLAEIVMPQVVAITNVGATHLEFLGSVEGVAREKLSLITSTGESATLIINADDPVLVREAARLGRKPMTFGVTNQADFQGIICEQRSDATVVEIDGNRFVIKLFGEHQVYNLLAAYAIVRAVGQRFDQVDTTRISLASSPMRGDILKSHGVTFIVDCYNANPGSVTSGLRTFVSRRAARRRIAILGDMLELGESGPSYHRQMGELAADRRIDIAVFVGPLCKDAFESALASGRTVETTFHFADARSCARETAALFGDGDLIYVKGSRGIGLEVVVEPWRVPEGVV